MKKSFRSPKKDELRTIQSEKNNLDVLKKFLSRFKENYITSYRELEKKYNQDIIKDIKLTEKSFILETNGRNRQFNDVWNIINLGDNLISIKSHSNLKQFKTFFEEISSRKNEKDKLFEEFKEETLISSFFIGNVYLKENLSLRQYMGNCNKSNDFREEVVNFYENILKEEENNLLKKELIILQKKDLEENKEDREVLIEDNKTIKELTLVLALGVLLNVFYYTFDFINRAIELTPKGLISIYGVLLLSFFMLGISMIFKIYKINTRISMWIHNQSFNIYLGVLIGLLTLPLLLILFNDGLDEILKKSDINTVIENLTFEEVEENKNFISNLNSTYKKQETNISDLNKEIEELKKDLYKVSEELEKIKNSKNISE